MAISCSRAVDAVGDAADASLGRGEILTSSAGDTDCTVFAREAVGWVAGHCLTNCVAVVARQRQATHRGVVHVSVIGSFIAGEALPVHAASIAVDSGAGNTLKVLRILRIPNGTDVVADILSSQVVGSGIWTVEKLIDYEVEAQGYPIISRIGGHSDRVIDIGLVVESTIALYIKRSKPNEGIILPHRSPHRIRPPQPRIVAVSSRISSISILTNRRPCSQVHIIVYKSENINGIQGNALGGEGSNSNLTGRQPRQRNTNTESDFESGIEGNSIEADDGAVHRGSRVSSGIETVKVGGFELPRVEGEAEVDPEVKEGNIQEAGLGDAQVDYHDTDLIGVVSVEHQGDGGSGLGDRVHRVVERLALREDIVHLIYTDAHVVANVHLRVAEGEGELVGVDDLRRTPQVQSSVYRDCR